jgi:hypothetical protein
MADIRPITKDAYRNKSWKKVPNYLFAATDSACAITIRELAKAVLDLPVGFIKTGGRFQLVSILGLKGDTNLYVNEQGQWLGKYPPAALRIYPFSLAQNSSDDDQLIFCVDHDSGLISNSLDYEPFFEKDIDLAETLTKVLGMLGAIHQNRQDTAQVIEVLDELNLIMPWNVQIEFEEGIHRVDGLFGIDEASLADLSDKEFLRLRDSGALAVAYSQILSMQNIETLIQRAEAKSAGLAPSKIDEIGFGSIVGDGNINFDNL